MSIETLSFDTSRLDGIVSPARRELWYRSYRRFANQPMSVVGLVIVVAIALAAVFAPYIAPYPEQVGSFTDFANAYQPPSLTHPFGTDSAGRDILTRVMFGYRIALLLVAVVLGLGVPVGVMLGLVAGYAGGWVDTIIMRVTDTFLALPPLVLALAIASAFEPTLEIAMFAIASLWWTWYARLARGLAASLSDEEYVQAAELAGASTTHVLFRELLPNCLSPLLVKATLDAGIVVLTGASLSFIGLGVQPPRPGLGTMVANGTEYLPAEWWISIFPGLAIFVLVMGFNMLGDGLRDLFDVEVEQ
ncbi:ABC transporter permease [Haloarcula japonica]|uniref:Binding-protein-dependent transport systems inner membrane component n=1 Tax=Haloarcula japonica (strain ATCC 49778 / DSM 6131 / JCM 7785 / NBRC 101032 / NCIMB 13157 / TR-1) TaxID=1227453 RepID=M0L7I9_HALJT|nr:ABC transporter permease [Haloarcula japonica]EMA28444.1 binding-protein-dependent transport systems inner membrane component [Haloarcula japonica DSM 6131]